MISNRIVTTVNNYLGGKIVKHSIGVRCATGSSGMSDQRMEMTRGLLEEVENINQLLYELMFNVYRRNLISHSSF